MKKDKAISLLHRENILKIRFDRLQWLKFDLTDFNKQKKVNRLQLSIKNKLKIIDSILNKPIK